MQRAKRDIKDILGPDKEDELLQSFVRVGFDDEDNGKNQVEKDNLNGYTKKSALDGVMNKKQKYHGKSGKVDSESLKKRKPKESFNEFYTDKDRAAAVSAGSYDIKQSLKLKIKQDRNETLLILSEEADPNALSALALKEIKRGNIENALQTISRALNLNGNDINALVSRSKCYLFIGEPEKALQDAETALNLDKNNIRAIYQKAESLYYLGQFELSLMFFHRGLKLRPELASFRLGIQKTQKAIENTIGLANDRRKTNSKIQKRKPAAAKFVKHSNQPLKLSMTPKVVTRPKKVDNEKQAAKKLLGDLCVDKNYLEKLLNHPDLKKDKKSENIHSCIENAINFLDKRSEFWRQQQCTSSLTQKNLSNDTLPVWF